MKEKLMNNSSLKLLAGILAFSLWIIINNIEDPVNTKVFRNIQVEIENEEALTSLDKVYEILTGGTINVTASAKSSVLRNIQASDIVAVADLSQLSVTNAVSIQLTCPKYENVTLKSDVEMLRITLEDEATAQFKVDVKTVGAVADGYALGEIRVRPNLIKVSGAQSQIDRISEVRVEVDVSDCTEGFSSRIEPKVYDANGKLMDSSRMTFSNKDIRVNVEINDTKTIPVELSTKGTPAEGYHVIATEYEPKQILVTGNKKNLGSIDKLPITVDVDGLSENKETEIALADYLPDGITIVGDVTTINVRLVVSRQVPKKVKISLSDIEVRNLDDDFVLEYTGKKNSIEVSAIFVTESARRELNASDIKAYVDCSDMKEGTYTLKVQFVVDKDILVVSENTVEVQINKKKQNEGVTTPTVQTTPDATETPKPDTGDEDEKKEQESEEEPDAEKQ